MQKGKLFNKVFFVCGSVESLDKPAPQGSTRSLNKSIALIISRAGTPAARPLRVVTTAGGLHHHAKLVMCMC
ncbi:MAG: hypothetical protein HZB67_04560 [Candidatus Aenigmarchaeota archaeon]|nr:hypothetical protein [Candidatus Aenigmarchaeota archaeon]